MRRSFQVAIAVLVLSVRLWDKLFFVSDFIGKSPISNYFTRQSLTWCLVGFILLYYLTVKVLQ